MPYNKRTNRWSKKAPSTNIRRVYGIRRMQYTNRKSKVSLNTHHFKYKYLKPNFTSVEMNGLDSFFSRNFKLSELPNYLELTNMFDMYRINKVVAKIIPRQGANINYQTSAGVDAGGTIEPNQDFGGTNLLGVSNFGMPSIVSVLDFNDSVDPTTYQELLEYSSCKRSIVPKEHTRILVPRINIDVENVNMSTSKRWIAGSKPDVEHYGIKGGIINVPNLSPNPEDPNDHPVMFFDLEVTYYISLKSTK